ncbi:MAG: type II secretion system protein [Candidatus Nanopelagicales bacterium]|nr:type II secretion system protein [Candidatus Nanopelagicales bacterium]
MNTWRRQSGFTLIELLVTMVLLGVVGTIVVIAVVNANRAFLRSDDESRGLGDAKNVLDQVARDIRSSRGVVCDGGLSDPDNPESLDPDCVAHLQLWVDSDSDYAQDATEVITWNLEQSADGEHYDVVRTEGNGNRRVIASSLIIETLFEYDTPDPEDASLVTVTMTYDARPGAGIDPREAQTSARVRNG